MVVSCKLTTVWRLLETAPLQVLELFSKFKKLNYDRQLWLSKNQIPWSDITVVLKIWREQVK
jgi:hypothetical protein